MEWTEIIITVPAAELDRAGDIAQMVVPYGIYIEDYSNLEEEAREIAHIDLIDEALLQKDRSKGLIHIYLEPGVHPEEAVAFLKERYTSEHIGYEVALGSCAEEDWMNNWKQYFHPIPVGEKLLIRPVWEEAYDAGDRVVLHLEPGIAFGTGTHETTRLCLELLERAVFPGAEVLDVGCGSGILSVAALLLGAKRAVGVDIDALAVKTAGENAAINGVQDRFTAICGNLTDQVTGEFHVVVANIVADVVIDLIDKICAYLAPGAVFLMSGIIDDRLPDVKKALAGKFSITEEREERGWVALAAVPLR